MRRIVSPANDDSALVCRARDGDSTAIGALVARYGRLVHRVALRIVGRCQDAEEVVQQTSLSVVEHVQDFRQQSSFASWLLRIATNHALVLLRKRSRYRSVPLADDRAADDYDHATQRPWIAQRRETPEQIVSRRETRQLLDRALADLDEKYRLVFLLRDVEGLSCSETADALGISEPNVKIRLLRARSMLRARLARHMGRETALVALGD